MRGDGRLFRHKRNGQVLPTWHIAFFAPVNGRPTEIRESTGTADERKARLILKERLREVGNHRAGVARFQGPRQERVTVGTLLDALAKDYEQREIKGLREAMNHSRPVRDFFGTRRAMEVTPDLVREYIVERRKSLRVVAGKRIVGLANATINRETEILGRAFRLAVSEGTLSLAPKIPRLPRKQRQAGLLRAR